MGITNPKKLTVSGVADVQTEGDRLTVQAVGGLVGVVVTDLTGNVLYMHHPLSGWYVEADMRHSSPKESPRDPRQVKPI